MKLRHAEETADEIIDQTSAADISLLIDEYIEQHPIRRTPDEARTTIGAVPVWAIIGHLEAVRGDIKRAAEDYDLDPDAVIAAAAYFHRHRDSIIARIAANAGSSSLLEV